MKNVFVDTNVLVYAAEEKTPFNGKKTDCEILYTEDLNDGQDYGGVRVVNPFH